MNKTLLLRRKLVAYADYCIAFKKLATYEDFAKLVGMIPSSSHISDALNWMAELDLVNNHPIRSSVFVKIPKKDADGNIVRPSIPGEGYFKFCLEHGLIKENVFPKEFWTKQLKKFGYKEEDLVEYGVKFYVLPIFILEEVKDRLYQWTSYRTVDQISHTAVYLGSKIDSLKTFNTIDEETYNEFFQRIVLRRDTLLFIKEKNKNKKVKELSHSEIVLFEEEFKNSKKEIN